LDNEEIESMLRALRGALGEAGFGTAGLSRDAPPEEGPVLDGRGELMRVIEEYEAILVLAPTMTAETMRILDARSIEFVPDPSDLRFTNARIDGARRLASPGEGVSITADDLAEWMGIASQASTIITEVRRMLDGYQS
jgi:hypothetical protein